MAKYSDEMIAYVLQRLDGLDVLEFIDYHPETIQRTGDEISSWCPLCQDRTGRYLRIDLNTRLFESNPPNGPEQRGNLIDLFARARRMPYEEAIEALADEFSIPLLEGEFKEQLLRLAEDAEAKLEQAEEPEKREVALRLAEDAFRRLLQFDEKNLRAHRGLFLVYLMRGDQKQLATFAGRLMDLMEETQDHEGQMEVAHQYLKLFPQDLPIRERLVAICLANDLVQDAVGELLTLADSAESTQQFDKALGYYRQVQKQKVDFVDVLPMIVSLLTAQGKTTEAKAEIQRDVIRLKEEGKGLKAAEAALSKLEIDPKDDETRLQVVELAILGGLDEGGMALSLRMVDEMMKGERFAGASEALTYLVAEKPESTLLLEMLITVNKRLGEGDLTEELEFRLIDLYMQEGKKDAAFHLLDEMLKDNAQNIRALVAYGDLLLGERRRSDAIEYLRRAMEAHMEKKERAEALGIVERILGLDPGLWDLRELEISLLFELHARDKALDHVTGLTQDLQATGDTKQLVSFLEKVMGWEPSYSEGRLLLSSLYEQLGDKDRSTDVRQKLIVDLLEGGEAEAAETAVRKLIEEDPKNPLLRIELADIYYMQQGKMGKAKEMYYKLDEELADSDHLQERRKILEKLVRMEPKNLALMARLSDVYTELGDVKGVVKTAIHQVRLLRETDDIDGALEQARMILEMEPEHEEAHRQIVEILRGRKNIEEARKYALALCRIFRKTARHGEEAELLDEIVADQPADIALLEQLTDALRRLNNRDALLPRIDQLLALNSYSTEKKLKLLRDCLKEMPGYAELQRRLTRLLKTAGRTDELIAEITVSIQSSEKAGRHVEVMDLYEELLEVEPDNIEARETLLKLLKNAGREARLMHHMVALARTYFKARRLEEAADSYELILEMDAENEDAYRGYAEVLRDRGDNEEASRKLRELAGLYTRRGDRAEAIKVLLGVSKLDPRNQEVRREIISLRRESGQVIEAAKDLGALAQVLREEGDKEGAITARREAVSLQPDSADIHLLLAEELKLAQRPDDTEAEYLNVVAKLSDKGDYKRALKILEDLLSGDEENIAARRARAHVYDQMGDEKHALQEYRELERLGQRLSTTVVQKLDLAAVQPTGPAGLDEEIGLELLPEYDFDSFVVGSKNKFAHATARAVADHPGSARNPLFLYSGVGLGKTHLLHAIANQMLKNNPRLHIVYTSTEYFTSALENAKEKGLLGDFRARHRQTDVLLLDDVQFLAGREESQEEFFHIFNMLYQARKQIVVTSDRPPKDIARLDMRLRTRFGQGVIVDIQPPDQETRLVILRAEALRRAFKVPEDALNAIAQRITSNVRELKGAFNLFLEYHEIGGEPLNAATAKDIVEKYYST